MKFKKIKFETKWGDLLENADEISSLLEKMGVKKGQNLLLTIKFLEDDEDDDEKGIDEIA